MEAGSKGIRIMPAVSAGTQSGTNAMADFGQVVVSQTMPNFLDRLLMELGLVCDVRHNIQDVAEALSMLVASRNDLQNAMDLSPQQTRPEQVMNWFHRVDEVRLKVEQIQQDYNHRCLFMGSFSPNIFSSYAISRRAVHKHQRVKGLLKEYDNVKNLTEESLPASCIPKHMQAVIVGKSWHLAKVLASLDNDTTGIISICGMAGVGKSELMRCVNNEFLPSTQKGEVFKFVIWVDCTSSDVNIIQDEIARRLKLGDLGVGATEGDEERRAGPIFSMLKETSFLLLLDNLISYVSLAAIGVPNPVHRRCARKQKVVLTTCFKSVCGQMESRCLIDVQCLNWDDSWNLFMEYVGQGQIKEKETRRLAQQVASECGGLPTALKKIGSAVSTMRQPDDWRRTVQFLKSSRFHQIPGMEIENTRVLRELKKSYDHGLFKASHRECFLCCALWPRGSSISKAELIDCWIGLGLISGSSHSASVLNGKSIIRHLQDANLLLHGENVRHEVKLQHVARDMALWIARDCGGQENKWLVQAGVNLSAKYEVKDLHESAAAAERVSLMHNSIQELPLPDHSRSRLTCPSLAVLMLQHNNTLKNISGASLQSATALTFLDLSHTAIEKLPKEIRSLAMLQYLNLSFTLLKALPMELKNLGRLKHLFLKHTNHLSSIPVGVFQGLKSLLVIDMYPSRYVDWEGTDSFVEMDLSMAFIEYLGITINTIGTAHLLGCLMNVSTRRLLMTGFNSDQSVTLCPSRLKEEKGIFRLLEMLLELSIAECHTLEQLVFDGEEEGEERNESWCLPKLENLELRGLTKLSNIIWKNVDMPFFLPALHCVKIENCSCLENVSWVMKLHCLQHLELRNCAVMKSVVDDHEAQDGQEQQPTFSSLMTLVLVNLPMLSSICRPHVSFTYLEDIKVGHCDLRLIHNIRSERSMRIQVIKWDEDSNVETSLNQYFVDTSVSSLTENDSHANKHVLSMCY